MPQGEPGFLGRGHIARPVITGRFSESDPFIMLMDDMLDKKDNEPVGGPHPHAGFETVSFLLEGEIGDEAHKMKAGDFQIMTAGSGIVHTETIDKIAWMRHNCEIVPNKGLFRHGVKICDFEMTEAEIDNIKYIIDFH